MQIGYLSAKRREMPAEVNFEVRVGTSDEKAIGEVFRNNSYQRKQFKIHPGDRWVDMGANIGAFSVFVGSLGCPVVSYEAEPYNAEATRRNLERNGIQGRVTNAAIVPMDHPDQTVTFYVSRRPMALRRHSIARPKKDYDIITVPAIKWRDAVPEGFDCVKMNIEGVEVDIMKRSRPEDFVGIRKLVFEWSFDKEPMVPVLRDVLAMLRKAFPYVDCNRGGLDRIEKWDFYPPNAFIYATR